MNLGVQKELNKNPSLPGWCSGSRRRLDWPHGASSNRSVRAVDKLGPLASLLRNNCDASGRADAKLLADLLRGMLRYDPTQRPSARACLRHEFFQVGLGFSGSGFRVCGLVGFSGVWWGGCGAAGSAAWQHRLLSAAGWSWKCDALCCGSGLDLRV